MAKILGLDLGTASIGWAVIETDSSNKHIEVLGAGSRVIPADTALINNFSKGKDCSVNADRTSKRQSRRMNQRFKIRRNGIHDAFDAMGVDLSQINSAKTPVEKWRLRAQAATEQISLSSLAEVLLHINSRRGYNASKEDLDENNKDMKGYVADVRRRYEEIKSLGLTPGEFFYARLSEDPNFRVKGEVLPRTAYKEEVDKILSCQSQYYPNELTPEVISRLRDNIIFYQRPLRSCKHLVSDCELESRDIDVNGEKKAVGPKVSHISNPLSQMNRIWQILNNISFTFRDEVYKPTIEQKEVMAQQLMLGKDLNVKAIKQMCGFGTSDRKWRISENAAKGIKGNLTTQKLAKILGNEYRDLTDFKIELVENVDTATGEVDNVEISTDVFNEPLYKIWHTVYSIKDIEKLRNVLRQNFGIQQEDILTKLISIDFEKQGYGKLSSKALRKILPYLMQGHVYSEACAMAGYNHSHSMTSEENAARKLQTSLPLIPKGGMRQPVVEKILNQMINIVNALLAKYGEFDSIHVEMARELKMSKDERDSMTKGISKNEKVNDEMRKRISEEYGLYPTMSRIVKMKLWDEANHQCIYCGANVGIKQFLMGFETEVEHIIPKSLLFDDSFANKACSCRKCNQEKGQMTAIDFMRGRSPEQLASYIDRISAMRDSKRISGTKYKYLMMPKAEIPEDFINRDLRETQYITKKALELLSMVCRDVMATSGKVTDYLRRQWGWDTLLHELNLPVYSQAGLTEEVKKESDGSVSERIKGWTKRLDHRHHALDALAIACTTRSVVNQLSHLNTLPDIDRETTQCATISKAEKRSRLENYVSRLPHISRSQAYDALVGIAVSLKPRTKLTTPGKVTKHTRKGKKCVQTGILIPRGPLHKETIYGKIKWYNEKTGVLEERAVVRYPLSSITKLKDAESIVDKHIRRLVIDRLNAFGGDAKKAFAEPLYSDAAHKQSIKSVRCFTGGTNLIGVRKNDQGTDIGFAAPGSNHHVALYIDNSGELKEKVASFFHCAQRKRHGIPVIIKDPSEVWSEILKNPEKYDDEFLKQLPADGMRYSMHMQVNEMFILGLDDATFDRAMDCKDTKLLMKHLYRVQNLSSKAYLFSTHTTTLSSPESFDTGDERFKLVKSFGKLEGLNPHKVVITNLGEIMRYD